MKKKKSKLGIILLVLIIIGEAIAIWYLATSKNETTTNTTTTISEKQVSTQTIENTLTASGEVATSSTEKLSLTTTKYFKTMCVEENDEVAEGANILQYSDGTYLTAPYNCLVSAYSVPETGSICTSSNSITIENLDTLTMTLSVDETEIGNIAKGQEVEITVNAFEDKTYTGTITKINELGTYASSGTTFTATVTFANDGNIKLGMSASSTIILEKVENVLAVPIEAIQTKQNEKYVIVVNNDGTTTDTTVTTGVSNDEYVEIKSGLTEKQTVQVVTTSTTSTGTSSSKSSTQGTGSSTGFDKSQMSGAGMSRGTQMN